MSASGDFERRLVPTGIAGLDGIFHGGFLRNRTMLVLGGPGTGKTVLGLQFLVNGATRFGETGMMVSFEESPAEILQNAASFPWFPEQEDKRPALIDGRMPEDTTEAGRFDLRGLIELLDAQKRRLDAKRIVIDGMDALFATHAQDQQYRPEFLRVMRWLADAQLTAIVTLKPTRRFDDDLANFEFAEYMTSSAMRLEVSSNARLVQRWLQVVKRRGEGFETGRHPFVISRSGFDVAYAPREKGLATATLRTRRSTGITRLDRMIGGGLRSGTVTLISGLPGTAKTTIGGAFLETALKAGDRALLVGFDEPGSQMIVDLESVGIHLSAYEKKGMLRTAAFSASAAIADEHYLAIERLVKEHEPAVMVVDPISALVKSGGVAIADLVCEHLVDLVKSRGITTIFTAVSSRSGDDTEDTDTKVSTMADTWIHLSYTIQNGERNRTLTVVKSRGTGHSNQMRELLLSDQGLTLKDVYVSEGAVLLGTARLEREQRDRAAKADRERKADAALRELESRRERVEAQVRNAQAELADVLAAIETLRSDVATSERIAEEQREARLLSRHADPEAGKTE